MVGVLSSWRDNIKPRMHPKEDGIVTWKEYDKGKSSEPLEPAWEPELHLIFQRAEPCIQTRRDLPGWGWGRTQKVVHTGQSAGFLEPDGWRAWVLNLLRPGFEQTSFWASDSASLNISCLTYEAWIISPSQAEARKERDACAPPCESPRVYSVFVIIVTTWAIQLVWGRGWRRRREAGGWMRKGPGLRGEECGCYLKGNG